MLLLNIAAPSEWSDYRIAGNELAMKPNEIRRVMPVEAK